MTQQSVSRFESPTRVFHSSFSSAKLLNAIFDVVFYLQINFWVVYNSVLGFLESLLQLFVGHESKIETAIETIDYVLV